jgi:hypothetical protein
MKLKFLSQCFMLAIALLFSCKKNEKEKFSDHKKAISEKIESWLSTNPGFSNNQTVMVEGKEIKLAQTIEWERSAYFAETQTNIIPVRIESANGKLPIFKYIVTILDDAGNIIECNYYNLFTKNMASESSEQTIITPDLFSFKKIPENFTGAIIKYDLQNKMLLSRHYDSGIATNETDNVLTIKNTNRPLDENIAPPDPNCYFITIDWYWQTWVNGVLVYEQYIGSSTYLFCEGGGGGGNNGGNSGPCNFTLAQAQAELNAITYERNLISSCSPPIYPPQFTSYPITSPRSCSTGVVTLHFFAGITASYTAFFTGAIQKDGANIPWKWNTFQYNTTNLTDGTIPICFGVDKNVTANCVISGDRLYANAHVSFNFIAKVLCLSGWTPAPPYTGSFNQIFEAN